MDSTQKQEPSLLPKQRISEPRSQTGRPLIKEHCRQLRYWSLGRQSCFYSPSCGERLTTSLQNYYHRWCNFLSGEIRWTQRLHHVHPRPTRRIRNTQTRRLNVRALITYFARVGVTLRMMSYAVTSNEIDHERAEGSCRVKVNYITLVCAITLEISEDGRGVRAVLSPPDACCPTVGNQATENETPKRQNRSGEGR